MTNGLKVKRIKHLRKGNASIRGQQATVSIRQRHALQAMSLTLPSALKEQRGEMFLFLSATDTTLGP